MQVFIVGSGKLALELRGELSLPAPFRITVWPPSVSHTAASVVIHAGSGRELDAVVDFCEGTDSVLLELATGSRIEHLSPTFPVVLCPNTNILMLKFMNMLTQCGEMFAGYRIELSESHQSQKRSTPGTAVAIANALGIAESQIVSVRDPEVQTSVLDIPPEHLRRHAVHLISIADDSCRLSFESRVYGGSPYADGVSRIVSAVAEHPLERRLHTVDELVRRGWL